MKTIALGVLAAGIIGAGAWQFMNTDASGALENEPVRPVTSAEGAPEGSLHNLPVPDAVAAAKDRAAQDAGVAVSAVTVLSAFEKEWPDACLGLAGEDEMCAMMMTAGYEVKALANGAEYVYRTNADGTVVRLER